jgi:hypothetical protein
MRIFWLACGLERERERRQSRRPPGAELDVVKIGKEAAAVGKHFPTLGIAIEFTNDSSRLQPWILATEIRAILR